MYETIVNLIHEKHIIDHEHTNHRDSGRTNANCPQNIVAAGSDWFDCGNSKNGPGHFDARSAYYHHK